MTKEWSKKETKQVKKALAALDTAVQKWYDVNVPENTERYATCHVRTYQEGYHVSELTLKPNEDTDDYVDLESSKATRNKLRS